MSLLFGEDSITVFLSIKIYITLIMTWHVLHTITFFSYTHIRMTRYILYTITFFIYTLMITWYTIYIVTFFYSHPHDDSTHFTRSYFSSYSCIHTYFSRKPAHTHIFFFTNLKRQKDSSLTKYSPLKTWNRERE